MSASLLDTQIKIDGSALYRELRTERPVYHDKDVGMYVVSRYEDIRNVFRQPNLYSNALAMFHSYNHDNIVGDIMTKEGHGPFKEVLPMTDPPIHMRVRTLTTMAFSPRRIDAMQNGVKALIGEYFDSFINDGRLEVVSQLALPLPVTIICDLLSLPRSRAEDVKRWTRAYTACAGNRIQTAEEAEHVGRDQAEMQNCIMETYARCRASANDSLLKALCSMSTAEFEPLDEGELLAVAAAIMVAGHETTTVAMTNMFKYLATVPGAMKRLRSAENPDKAAEDFCHEVLRLTPPVKMHPRVTTEDTVLGSVNIPKFSPVMVITASANRDEEFFENPADFIAGRNNGSRHMSFGVGIHSCLGMQLAMIELKCLVRTIITRVDRLQLATPDIPISDYEAVIMPWSYQLKKLDVLFERR